MSILADYEIANLVTEHGMIAPYRSDLIREKKGKKIISYGQSSYGYDIRLANSFLVVRSSLTEIDPKNMKVSDFDEVAVVVGEPYIIAPRNYVLGMSVEYFKIPSFIIGQCLGKSTYARCGIIINVTPLEPGWHGRLTLEISNNSSFPALVYPDEGIAQIVFHKPEHRTQTDYAKRGGKYQAQTEVTPARL